MDKNQLITADECAHEVNLMARRTALLHHYFSKTLVEELVDGRGSVGRNEFVNHLASVGINRLV